MYILLFFRKNVKSCEFRTILNPNSASSEEFIYTIYSIYSVFLCLHAFRRIAIFAKEWSLVGSARHGVAYRFAKIDAAQELLDSSTIEFGLPTGEMQYSILDDYDRGR